MAQETPAPLTMDDLQQLDDLQMSGDPNSQAQATAIAKTLTPGEQQRFLVVQQQRRGGNERSRPDNTLLGMPPEGAVMTGLAAGVPAARALTKAGTTVAQKAVGAAGGLLTGVSPVIKYEVTKHALEAVGLPSPLAMMTAMAISGYRKGGGKVATTEADPVAAESTPTAAPSSPVPDPIPTAGTLSGSPSPTPTAPPAESILSDQAVMERKAATTPSAVASADIFHLTPAEIAQAEKWHGQGVPPKVIVQRILASRQFTTATKGVTPDEAAAKVQSALHTGKF